MYTYNYAVIQQLCKQYLEAYNSTFTHCKYAQQKSTGNTLS